MLSSSSLLLPLCSFRCWSNLCLQFCYRDPSCQNIALNLIFWAVMRWSKRHFVQGGVRQLFTWPEGRGGVKNASKFLLPSLQVSSFAAPPAPSTGFPPPFPRSGLLIRRSITAQNTRLKDELALVWRIPLMSFAMSGVLGLYRYDLILAICYHFCLSEVW